MAYVASSEYSRVTSDSNERRGPRFGMEKGTRVHPGQIYLNGKYINETEFLKVRKPTLLIISLINFSIFDNCKLDVQI